MRINALMKYHFMTIKRAILIFYSFYLAGMFLGAVLSTVTNKTVGVGMVTSEYDAQTWTSSMVAFVIFMVISSLIASQKDARFLITRSVSRKEIFISNAIFLIPLAGIMSALQIISIYIDGSVRRVLGDSFKGLKLDIQSMQAPNMKNLFVFFAVSAAIMICFGAASFLLGSLMARWKVQTIGVLIILGIALITFLSIPDFLSRLIDAFEYMYTDQNSGIFIALKQIVLACAVMAAAFPIMRRITAAKQSQ